jgi:adenine-specific DNA-methyltransferase
MSKQSSSKKIEIERLDLRSLEITADKIAALRALFPEVLTEGGKVDFERLKLALGGSVDTGKERYGMNWPGKAECFKVIQQPSVATLQPARAESVDFDTTENLIIEGDNLEVLKLLQKSYLGKVKLMFIDPPYNTGNDFIYPDNYTESLDTYLRYTGQVDSEGRKYSTNTEADGRFHTKWLNMMYPRLYLARNLLSDDGVIFISIDDHEVDNLRKICYEVFGEDNFVAQIEWQKRYTRSNNTDDFTSVLDHILVFAQSDKFQPQLAEREEEANARYQNPDNDPRGPWKAIPFLNPLSPEERPNLAYDITHPSGRVITPKKKAWRSEETVWKRLVAENRVWWGKEGDSEIPNIKRFLSEVRQGMTPINLWDYEYASHTDAANQELKELFDGQSPFDFPKPTRLIQRMMQLAAPPDENFIVLDFFGGSGTTGHAVLDLNRRGGGCRSFILVQLPERTDRTDFPTIAEITKERMRRVIKKLNSEDAGKLALEGGAKPDRGFKVFKLQSSNFKTWNADAPKDQAALAQQLEMHVHHIVDGRSQEDLLFEILLKSGFPLSTAIEKLTLERKTVFSIAGDAMLICLEKALTPDVIKAIADRKPERVVCLDEGFAGNDQLKTNAVQQMRARGVTKFQTV